ncbi:Carboxymuconolactone decarboxylase family protein [compost metagenome]
MNTASLYPRVTPAEENQLLRQLFAHDPKRLSAFHSFSQAAFADGALSLQFKELIAVSLAHITGCPYCIELHVSRAKEAGVTLEELAETSAVAAAVQSFAAFALSANTLQAYYGKALTDLYSVSNLELLDSISSINERIYDAQFDFIHSVLADGGHISEKDKLIIAVGCAQVLGNAYAIEYFTRRAAVAGIQIEQLAEVGILAAALKAGSAIAHQLNTIFAFERE